MKAELRLMRATAQSPNGNESRPLVKRQTSEYTTAPSTNRGTRFPPSPLRGGNFFWHLLANVIFFAISFNENTPRLQEAQSSTTSVAIRQKNEKSLVYVGFFSYLCIR